MVGCTAYLHVANTEALVGAIQRFWRLCKPSLPCSPVPPLNMLTMAKETKMQILSCLQTLDQTLTNLFLKPVIDTVCVGGGGGGKPSFLYLRQNF